MIDMERFLERNIRLERFGMHDLSDSGQVVTCGLVITKNCCRWCATSSKMPGRGHQNVTPRQLLVYRSDTSTWSVTGAQR